jgi:hypothetical protein
MSKARIKGINDFHALVAHHHLSFEEKWIKNQVNQSEDILGSPDVSSAGDFSMVYESVKNMTVFPFNIKTMVITVVMSLLPLLVVFALQMPVADILQMLMGILL